MTIQTGPIAGFLNVDKPQGWTSSDVVVKLRSALQLRKRRIKIGHGGTLDPLATGVLPICVGYATRLSEYLLSSEKTYLMSAKLGVATDTYDSEGEITETSHYAGVSRCRFKSIVEGFVGEIDQTPPMFSAIKKDGQPLYKLARQGKSIHRPPRRVNVDSLTLTEWNPPHFSLRIQCGSGFYARSLAHDIGQSLGCGAHMTSLRRERAGEFRIEDAISIDALIAEADGDAWSRHLQKPDTVLKMFGAIVLSGDQVSAFRHGHEIPASHQSELKQEKLVRIYSPKDDFLGLASYEQSVEVLKPTKVFTQ